MNAKDSMPTHLTVREALLAHAALKPDEVFLTFFESKDSTEQSWTYGQTLQESWRIAHLILAEGFREGDRLLLVYPASPDYIFALFACQLIGVVPVPVYPPGNRKHLDRLHKIIASCRAEGILTKTEDNERLRSLMDELMVQKTVRVIIRTDQARLQDGDTVAVALGDRDRVCLLQYTSGSTGDPKGVVVTESSVRHNAANQHISMAGQLSGPTLAWLPLYHDFGLIGALFQSIIWGYPFICFSSYLFVQRPHVWLRLIDKHRAVRTGAPNFAFEHCVQRILPSQIEGLDLSCLKLAFCGGEPIRSATLDAFSRKFSPYGFDPKAFVPCYGLAEATLLVSMNSAFTGKRSMPLSREDLAARKVTPTRADAADALEVVSCGSVPENMSLAIVDPDSKRRCPPNTVGEIWVSGPSLAKGYWNRPDLTEQVFAARIHEEDGPDPREYLRTGDFGTLIDGELFVTGRLKEVIIINGRNFYPNDIEECLEREQEALEPANSVATSSVVDGREQLMIFAQLKRVGFKGADYNSICKGISVSVTNVFGITPAKVVLVPPGQIPKTSSGKLKRVAIAQQFNQGALKVAHVH